MKNNVFSVVYHIQDLFKKIIIILLTSARDLESFLLAKKFNVNDGRRNLLHHVSDEVILVAETVRIPLSCRNQADCHC